MEEKNRLDDSTIFGKDNSHENLNVDNIYEDLETNVINNKYTKIVFNPQKHFDKVFQKIKKTYFKRHPIVNAVLSLFFGITLLVSFCVSYLMVALSLFSDQEQDIWSFIIMLMGVFYPIYSIYYMYLFVAGNRKYAITNAFMGSLMVWFFFIFLVGIVFYMPYDADDGFVILLYIFAFALALIFNTICVLFIYLVMRIKRHGISAWTLLEVSRKRFRTKFDKIAFYSFFILLLFPIGIKLYQEYEKRHQKNISFSEVKVGDYYYEDGTISSDLLSGKNVIGVVFSLKTSEIEKKMGYKHGQIVAISDLEIKSGIKEIVVDDDNIEAKNTLNSHKVPWSPYELTDIKLFPNYTWENRIAALNDMDGYKYKQSEDTCITVNSFCDRFERVDGISEWYVPTAGQWANIIENIGKVKVDNLLRFDANVACDNLKKTHINPQRWYWTITEFDEKHAWSIRPFSGEFGSRTFKQNKAYVRPVASF